MAKLIRLNAILQLVDSCKNLFDIGCDHGKFSKMVLDNKLAQEVIACDISVSSLSKAKTLLKSYDNVRFIACDGKQVVRTATDTVVISGLGGNEIVKIINGAQAKTLILQPQNHVMEVRRALNSFGYKIVSDKVIMDGGKFYDCIKAVPGLETLSELQYIWGAFCFSAQAELALRLDFEQEKTLGYAKTQANLLKLQNIKEVKKWQ